LRNFSKTTVIYIYGGILKHFLSLLVIFVCIIGLCLNQVLPADAAKKSGKKKGLPPDVIEEITKNVDDLTKKIYERELYTPEDANMLIGIKLQLDEQMDALPEASFAPIYFKIGNIYKMRGEDKDAINCYQTVLENFAQTAYGPKSKDILESMGIEIKTPVKQESDEEEI